MKPKHKSKTLWFNGLTATLTGIMILQQYVDVIGLDPVVAGRLGLTLAILNPIVNYGLRLVTTEAVE